MPVSDRLRDYDQEANLFRRRALVAAVGIAVLLAGLLARLIYLQGVAHEHYTTLSEDNRVRIEAIPPTRGLIRDRDGRLLAANRPSFELALVPERVDDLDDTLARLEPLIAFDERDVERLRSAWARARPFEEVPLRFQLSEAEVARFEANRHRFQGVDIVAGLRRYYPYGRTGVHALGYVGRLNERELQRVDTSAYRATSHIGKRGIEQAYEAMLHGEPGVRRVEINAQGRTVRVLERQAPARGRDVEITIDWAFQRLAERLLEPDDAAAVALDPRDGQVLALASTPRFDPNQFVNGISDARYGELRDSPHRPLFNRTIQGRYPPGSTIKPFVALNGLEADARERDDAIDCEGYYRLDGTGRRYRDWKAHGEIDLADAITQSCDVMFYDLAVELGIDRMAGFLRQLGFGQRTGIDIPGERAGLVPDRAWKRRNRGEPWYRGETPIHGIGQGFLNVTPLQLASATAMLANRGEPVRPHLVRPRDAEREDQARADGDAGGAAPAVEPLELQRATDWAFVIDAMVGVTEGDNGTARAVGFNSPHTIAGKTGTAQVFGLGQDEEYDADEIAAHLRDHALFIAFAPAEQPRIAVAVLVENGGSGSSTAAPIARKLIDAWLGQEQFGGDDGDA
jgi:penicillin-binding protein 2